MSLVDNMDSTHNFKNSGRSKNELLEHFEISLKKFREEKIFYEKIDFMDPMKVVLKEKLQEKQTDLQKLHNM